MEKYRKRLKLRLAVYIGVTAAGIAALLLCAFKAIDNVFFVWGAVFAAIGVVRTVEYTRRIKSEELLNESFIKENDERNLFINAKAMSAAVRICVLMAAAAVIALEFTEHSEAQTAIAYAVCTFLVVYCVCSAVIRKKY